MRKPILIAIIAVVVVVAVALGGWAVFEHFERADKIKNAGKPCGRLDVVTGNPVAPAGFTLPSGQKLLSVQSQGQTKIVYASVDGGRSDIVHARDQVTPALPAAGYKVTPPDHEPPF